MPKKNKTKSKTSVNVDAVRREASKMAKDAENKASSSLPGDLSRTHSELAPGSLQRQSPLEQEMGTKKYKDMIHDHNDKNKHILDRLPFTFPKKSVVRSHRTNVLVECVECGHESYGSEHTYMKVCEGCKKSTKVINPEADARGEDRDFTPGMFASASDILEMREKRRLAEEEKKKGQ
jgi:hypothetical protein